MNLSNALSAPIEQAASIFALALLFLAGGCSSGSVGGSVALPDPPAPRLDGEWIGTWERHPNSPLEEMGEATLTVGTAPAGEAFGKLFLCGNTVAPNTLTFAGMTVGADGLQARFEGGPEEGVLLLDLLDERLGGAYYVIGENGDQLGILKLRRIESDPAPDVSRIQGREDVEEMVEREI